MNFRVIQWLIRNRDLLTAVMAAAQKYSKNSSYLDQWSVVNDIARLVLPVLEREGILARDLAPLYMDDEEYAFALGAEVAAMGIDWKSLIDIVLPILLAILKALADKDDE